MFRRTWHVAALLLVLSSVLIACTNATPTDAPTESASAALTETPTPSPSPTTPPTPTLSPSPTPGANILSLFFRDVWETERGVTFEEIASDVQDRKRWSGEIQGVGDIRFVTDDEGLAVYATSFTAEIGDPNFDADRFGEIVNSWFFEVGLSNEAAADWIRSTTIEWLDRSGPVDLDRTFETDSGPVYAYLRGSSLAFTMGVEAL